MPTEIDPQIHRRARWRNRINTWLIIGGLTLLIVFCGWVLFGGFGVAWALGLSAAFWVITPQISTGLVLRMFRAQRVTPAEAPELYRILERLSHRAGLPAVPAIYYIRSSNMNAFAVGKPEDSAITLTDGLIRGLDNRQLIGVLAHEVSHVANEDLKIMGLADMVGRVTGAMQSAGLILLLLGLWQGTSFLLAAILLMFAPTIGVFLQLALSRSREYDADLSAVELTGDPAGLASALQTLERRQGRIWESVILPGGRTPDPSWLRTHPRTRDRIARLMELVPQYTPRFRQQDEIAPIRANLSPVRQRPHYHWSGFWY